MKLKDIFLQSSHIQARLLRTWWKAKHSTITEMSWASCAFLLFLIAGPFSAPVVLLALAQLARTAQEENLREPLSL